MPPVLSTDHAAGPRYPRTTPGRDQGRRGKSGRDSSSPKITRKVTQLSNGQGPRVTTNGSSWARRWLVQRLAERAVEILQDDDAI